MLARPELEQLAQRVIARFHLQALSADETAQYIRHRLSVAGMSRALPFDGRALKRIHRLSRGVPRRINLLCDRALLGAYAVGRPRVEADIVDKAAVEVFGTHELQAPAATRWRRMATMGAGGLAGIALVGVVAWATDAGLRRPARVTGTVAATPATGTAPAQPAASAALTPVALRPVAAASAPSQPAAPLPAPIRTEQDAWRELAQAWRAELGAGEPCVAARQQQLQCFKSPTVNLAVIRQLGRPGIVTLQADGRSVPALLTGLNGHGATLSIGSATDFEPRPTETGVADIEPWTCEVVYMIRCTASLCARVE